MKKIFYALILISIFQITYSRESPDEVPNEQLKIGNFALPSSQQPGPLIGFGQNIIDKNDFLLFLYVDYLKGNKKKFVEVAPSFLYAIRDDLSIFVEFPYATFKINNQFSRGIEDLLIQFEYAFYVKETPTSVTQFTVVPNITIATGSEFQAPPLGLGAPSFFLGLTANHMNVEWYYFASFGAILTFTHNNKKFGNQFLYQFGLSQNICFETEKWILNWMVELDGIYRQQDKFSGKINPNSGGNQILLGPSFYFATQNFSLQGGISWIIYQKLFGTQNKDNYYAAINLSWKF